MFSRATMMLGIGPHSSSSSYDIQWKRIYSIPFILKSYNNTDTANQNAYFRLSTGYCNIYYEPQLIPMDRNFHFYNGPLQYNCREMVMPPAE